MSTIVIVHNKTFLAVGSIAIALLLVVDLLRNQAIACIGQFNKIPYIYIAACGSSRSQIKIGHKHTYNLQCILTVNM